MKTLSEPQLRNILLNLVGSQVMLTSRNFTVSGVLEHSGKHRGGKFSILLGNLPELAYCEFYAIEVATVAPNVTKIAGKISISLR